MDGTANPYDLLTDAELRAMRDHAYWRAVRSWRAVQAETHPPFRAILQAAALGDDQDWSRLNLELQARIGPTAEATELETDQYPPLAELGR